MEHESNAKLVGGEVRKFFRGHGHFSGKLVSYDQSRSLFRVAYADGDQEELELHEVQQILVPGSAPPAKRPRGRPRKHPLPTPGAEAVNKTGDADHGELIQADKEQAPGEGTRSILKRQRSEDENELVSKRRNVENAEESPEKPEKQEAEKMIVENSLHEEKTPEQPVPKLRSWKSTVEDEHEKAGGAFKSSPHRRKSSLVVYPLRRTPTPCKQLEVRRAPERPEVKSSQEQEQEPEQKQELNIPPLPACSLSVEKIPKELLADLFSAFTFLRSFSWVVLLSPFTLSDFVSCMTTSEANPLFDQIHLSLLLLLRQHMEDLAKDGEEPAMNCLKCRNWALLDAVTWPSFLFAYLLNDEIKMDGIGNLLQAGALRGEYHALEAGIKIRILSFLCDRLLDTDEVRTELEKRTDPDPEADAGDFKTPASKPVLTRARKGGSPSDTSELVDPVVVSEQQEGVAVDGNTDDCVLCGMDGNLICCDGCPGAYHSRCVGVSRAALPDGDWFCPECVLQRSGTDGKNRRWKALRGFEFLGLDTFGRRYLAACEHLFISESSDFDSVQVCYGASEVVSCLEALESTGALSPELRACIVEQWKLPDGSSKEDEQGMSPGKDQSLPDTSCCMQNVAGTEPIFKPVPSSLKRHEAPAAAWGIYSYFNQYAWGASAALAASRLAERSGNRKLCVQKAQIFEQLNAFSQAPAQFSWPSFKRKHTEAPKDRCGWCFACKNLSRKKGCLLNTAAGKLSAGAAIVGGGLRPTRKGWSHLPALAAYILYMEDRLNGLLMGAWESFEQRTRWRRFVESSGSVRQVRLALAELGSSLRPLALSRNWASFAEDAPKLVPASILPANGYVAPRGRRRKNFPEGEPITCVRWWRGGKRSRKFQDWEVLPTPVLRRAARRGGGKRIPELVYSDNLEVPRRTASCAWRVRVESSSSVSELAIQVRCLDAMIRWSDLSIPEEARGLIKESLIRERASDGGSLRYLVESCRPEEEVVELLTPEVTFSAFKFVKALAGEEGGACKAQVWLPETQMPVCLIRAFEEKRRRDIFEEKKRIQMLEEKRRLEMLEQQRRIQLEEKRRIQLEERKRAQMLEERRRAQMLEEKKRMQQQMRAASAAAAAAAAAAARSFNSRASTGKPSGAGRRAANQVDVTPAPPGSNKLKIILTRPRASLEPAPEKILTCEQCNLDLSSRDSVSCEECQGDFHKSCLISKKKSADPLCQSCFIVKQSRRSRKTDQKTGGAPARSVEKPRPVALKPLQVYCRKRNQFPAPVNRFGGAVIARRKRSGRPGSSGVKWKVPGDEDALRLERDMVLLPGEQHDGASSPECGICHRAFDSSLVFVGCGGCREWFHGVALGIDEANVDKVLSFKCHKCRKKAPPLCPHKLVY